MNYSLKLLLFLCLIFSTFKVTAQTPTIGLITHTKQSYDSGYVLYSPMQGRVTYLMDKCGKEAHRWISKYKPGLSTYMLEDGSLLRTGTYDEKQTGFSAGGRGGIIEQINWNGNVIWSGVISDSSQSQHHDIYPLPNGNILAIVWEFIPRKVAIDAGRDTALTDQSVWSEKIVELRPMMPSGYTIVWEWRVWDHLIQNHNSGVPNFGKPEDHPELIDLNYYTGNPKNEDWLHINGIDYNEKTDQIMLSVHNWSEIWVIDHSTNMQEATGHAGGRQNKGGDLLWRWGNPAAYGHGDTDDQVLFQQHNAHWIASDLPNAGKIMVFNNGLGRPEGPYSTVEILTPPMNESGEYNQTLPYGPESSDWIYKDPINESNFYSSFISGAQMLPNGNVLICSGSKGTFFEVTPMKKTTWKYINPVNGSGPIRQGVAPSDNNVFRCSFYSYDFSAIRNHKLTQGNPLELNPYNYTCSLNIGKDTTGHGTSVAELFNSQSVNIYPNPANSTISISASKPVQQIILYNLTGEKVMEKMQTNQLHIQNLPTGIYILKVLCNDTFIIRKINIAH